MAFTILNDPAAPVNPAGFGDQAEWDKVDIDILASALAGAFVISGCDVTAQGTPDMTVAVASGSAQYGSLPVTVTAGNVNITAADATNPRIDLIAVNTVTGLPLVIDGTANANPCMPAIPGSRVVLASVYVPANDTAINTNQITDKRVIMNRYARLGGITGGQTLYGGDSANQNLTLGGTSDATHTTSIISMLDHVRMAAGKNITSANLYGDTADNGNLLLGGTSSATHTTSYIGMLDSVRIAAGKVIQDSGGGTRITLDGATPHVLLTGDVDITGTLYGDTAANGDLILGGTSNATHTTSIISMLDHVRLASGKVIQDSGGNTRITLGTSTPHVTLTGDVTVTGSGSTTTAGGITLTGTTSPYYGIAFGQNGGTITDYTGIAMQWLNGIGTTYTGILISPSLTTGANSATIKGIVGNAQATVNAHTGVTMRGLDFSAIVAPTGATTTGVVATHQGARVLAQVIGNATGGATTITITAQAGFHADRTFFINNSANTATVNITASRGLYIATPTFTETGAGTKVLAITDFLGIDVAAVARSDADDTITNAYGIRVGDITGTSFTAANNRIAQFGSATPTTTSGLFEVMANFTAAANETPVWISEGATPTRRQVKTRVWDGTAGHGMTNGDLVVYLA